LISSGGSTGSPGLARLRLNGFVAAGNSKSRAQIPSDVSDGSFSYGLETDNICRHFP